MQEKWNQFVYVLCEAKKKDVDEDTYHSLIEKGTRVSDSR